MSAGASPRPPDPTGGAYSAPRDPIAVSSGPIRSNRGIEGRGVKDYRGGERGREEKRGMAKGGEKREVGGK